jgi:hypothetical protein
MDDVMRPQTLAEVMKVVRAKIETGGPHDGDETMRLASLATSLVRDSKKADRLLTKLLLDLGVLIVARKVGHDAGDQQRDVLKTLTECEQASQMT